MASIIVAAPPYTGELQPLLQITGGLVQRGHAVTVVTASRFGARVAATGAGFVPFSGAADWDDRRFLEVFPGCRCRRQSPPPPGRPGSVDHDASPSVPSGGITR